MGEELFNPNYAIGICDVMEAIVEQIKITQKSKLKTKNHNSKLKTIF